MTTLREQAEEALRKHQDKIGVLRGGPNLYPGTAAKITADEWEPLVLRLFADLHLARRYVDVPEYQELIADTIRETKEALG